MENVSPGNTYLVDQEHPAELARLIDQDIFMLGVTGLYPASLPEAEVQGMQRVLDIGCGPGNWALMMGTKYPHLDVLGVDISSQMVGYAKGVAESREVDNVRFVQMNALEPLPFDDGFFDLVDVRFGNTWIPKQLYPAFLQECRRILKAGGIFCVTESENGMTTAASPALRKCFRWLSQAMELKGLGFGDGINLTATPALFPLCKQANFVSITSTAYVANASFGEPAHASMMRNLLVLLQLIGSLLKHLGISQEEFDETLDQLRWEIEQPDFAVLSFLLCVLARHP